MHFSKLQATGNDFILVDAREMEQDWAKLAQVMCDRHFGVGADGLILVEASRTADLKMRLFNYDGSEAEACGNGLRCLAKYAIERGIAPGRELLIETLSGMRKVKAYMSGRETNKVKVDMGIPHFKAEDIPVIIKQGREKVDIIPILNYPLSVEGRKLTLSLISIGNPHAVSFLSRSVSSFPLAKIGPKVESNPIFPQRTNFEIARVLNRHQVEARVWERGVGETLACGSGACAIAAVARLLDYVGNKVDIMLKGGVLSVFWDGTGEIQLTGPVAKVFDGAWLE